MEIINSVEIMESAGASGFAIIISFIGVILTGAGVALCRKECGSGNSRRIVTGVLSFTIGGMLLLYGLETINEETNTKVPTGRYRYECIVDEDYSMLELAEQYNIIDHNGNRYILEDKEK